MAHIQNIIISRVDNIGDVILTLPLAGVLKELYPNSKITLLGKRYTQPIIDTTENIDSFLDWDAIRTRSKSEQIAIIHAIHADTIIHVFPKKRIAQLAKQAKIPLRIGTSHRIYHWGYCNKKIHLGRRNSKLHEAQLNLKLIVPLGAKKIYSLSEIPKYYGLTKVKPLKKDLHNLLSRNKLNVILHPTSKGSAREWGLDNFSKLIQILPEEQFNIFITGTKEDRSLLKEFLTRFENRIVDLTGQLTLDDLISLLNNTDGIISASTGPLHISAALGKYVLGLYAPMRPIHPGRWSPVGKNADFLVLDKECDDCRKTMDCKCIRSILPLDVKNKFIGILQQLNDKKCSR